MVGSEEMTKGKKLFLFSLRLYLCIWVPLEVGRECWMAGAGVTGSCGLPRVGAGNCTQVFDEQELLITEPFLLENASRNRYALSKMARK